MKKYIFHAEPYWKKIFLLKILLKDAGKKQILQESLLKLTEREYSYVMSKLKDLCKFLYDCRNERIYFTFNTSA